MNRRAYHYAVVATCFVVLAVLPIVWWLFASPLARRGRESGFSAPSYTMVRTLQERAARFHDLNAAEVGTFRWFSGDRDWKVRVRVLTALADLRGSSNADAAAHIARSRLGDSEGIVRQYALRALELLRVPDLKEAAKRLENDPDEWARGKARRILGYPVDQR